MRRQRKRARAMRKNPERPDATDTPATEPGLSEEPEPEVESEPGVEVEVDVGPEFAFVVVGLVNVMAVFVDLGLAVAPPPVSDVGLAPVSDIGLVPVSDIGLAPVSDAELALLVLLVLAPVVIPVPAPVPAPVPVDTVIVACVGLNAPSTPSQILYPPLARSLSTSASHPPSIHRKTPSPSVYPEPVRERQKQAMSARSGHSSRGYWDSRKCSVQGKAQGGDCFCEGVFYCICC